MSLVSSINVLANTTINDNEEFDFIFKVIYKNDIENEVVVANPVRDNYDFVGWTSTGLSQSTKD